MELGRRADRPPYEAPEGRRKKAEAPADFTDFAHMILENLKAAGVQQAHKEDRITFTSLHGWPGKWVAAEGTFMEGDTQRRAGVFPCGPEFGSRQRPRPLSIGAPARAKNEAEYAGIYRHMMLIACALSKLRTAPRSSREFDGSLGRIKVCR